MREPARGRWSGSTVKSARIRAIAPYTHEDFAMKQRWQPILYWSDYRFDSSAAEFIRIVHDLSHANSSEKRFAAIVLV